MVTIIPEFILCNPIFTVLIIPLIIGLFASLIAVIFYDFIVFRRFYLNLCKEIDDNHRKISDDELNSQFSRMREILERRIQNPEVFEWIGFGKTISIWILVLKNDTNPTDYYRYLKNNDLRNFIQSRGYYHYIKQNEEVLTLFYLACENLSVQLKITNGFLIIHRSDYIQLLTLQPMIKND